jgi:hypothetical protein
MKRGDLAAVVIGLSLVIILTLLLSSQTHPSTQAAKAYVTTVPPTPVPGTTGHSASLPASPPVTAKRIFYTDDYYLFPIRFLPNDMTVYGFSDPEWQYNSSVAFAYVEENHGGITEPFTAPYPVWRMVSTLYARRTPETARFGMILVDEQTGRIMEGTEISHPGSVTRTVVTHRRPVYMIIQAEHLDRFVISLETPSVYAQ